MIELTEETYERERLHAVTKIESDISELHALMQTYNEVIGNQATVIDSIQQSTTDTTPDIEQANQNLTQSIHQTAKNIGFKAGILALNVPIFIVAGIPFGVLTTGLTLAALYRL